MLSLCGWMVCTEGLLQAAVLQGQDRAQKPALNIAVMANYYSVVKERKEWQRCQTFLNLLNLSAVRRKSQSSRTMRKIEEAVAEPMRTTDKVSSFTP